MKNDLIKRIISIVFSIILVVCTLYLLIQLVTLNVLPSKFLFIAVAILFLIDTIIVILINFYSKKSSIKNYIDSCNNCVITWYGIWRILFTEN